MMGRFPPVNDNSNTQNNNISDPNSEYSNSPLVNAEDNTTIGLEDTGLPLNYLILAVLMVISGLVPKRK